MNIVFATSECIPFAKTGGLADVCGALPREIAAGGQQISIFMPAYRQALEACRAGMADPAEPTGIEVEIPIGTQKLVRGRLLKSRLPQSQVPVYLVEQSDYFDREQLYTHDGMDYADNCERYVFFCRAVLDAQQQMGVQPDLIHCNDWQTALIPVYLDTVYAGASSFEQTATLLTIHNLAYQGSFWHWDMLLTGIDWKYFNWREMEFFGQLNFLKSGIVFSSALSTVSPTYAEEIQTEEHGCGLHNILLHRRSDLEGILNGIDPSWDPQSDPNLVANYGPGDWQLHKPKCRLDLQRRLQLDETEGPIIGLVGRLASQKGWSLVLDVMAQWLESIDAQWVVLGSGDPEYERRLRELAEHWPGKLGLHIGFDEALARRIEAGADLFLMPSEYEPCGLNQMYSLAYGTVPVVRRTGGLADTVVNLDADTLANGTANGFSFGEYKVNALESTLARAVMTFLEQPEVWKQLVQRGIQQDFSWSNSSRRYLSLYESTVARHRAAQPI